MVEITRTDSRTGKVIEGCNTISDGESGEMRVVCSKVYAEMFRLCPMLGRVIVRDRGLIVGYGVVKEVEY